MHYDVKIVRVHIMEAKKSFQFHNFTHTSEKRKKAQKEKEKKVLREFLDGAK